MTATTDTTPSATADTSASTEEGACGTLYGSDAVDCPITCDDGSYCASCLSQPEDTAAEETLVWTCVPCGAAC